MPLSQYDYQLPTDFSNYLKDPHLKEMFRNHTHQVDIGLRLMEHFVKLQKQLDSGDITPGQFRYLFSQYVDDVEHFLGYKNKHEWMEN